MPILSASFFNVFMQVMYVALPDRIEDFYTIQSSNTQPGERMKRYLPKFALLSENWAFS
jgi:hypothetical protein